MNTDLVFNNIKELFKLCLCMLKVLGLYFLKSLFLLKIHAEIFTDEITCLRFGSKPSRGLRNGRRNSEATLARNWPAPKLGNEYIRCYIILSPFASLTFPIMKFFEYFIF